MKYDHEKVDAMRNWALSRIEHCRKVIDAQSGPDSIGIGAYSEAVAERRALRAVLRQIDDPDLDDPEREIAGSKHAGSK